ncbi:tubulin binding cofactor C-domain-containing protein [Tribonema minus]|uniref:Tubulin binding cofactor C-domain-containing protein n=1 Tax=Tribonema minus TaxID=303371 RepID=A0A836CLR1_9STRA|nr:tubulin binding cofactor C-domain-containing protein [Tribonema minus]
MVFTATDGTVFTDRKAWRKHEFETQYTFRNAVDQTLIKLPGAVQGQPFDLSDLSRCEVQLLDASDMVQCDNLVDCRVFVAACAESLFVRNCSGCTFYAACKQLRTRDCQNCLFSLYSKTEPIIETSSGMKFGPFNGAYADHASHLQASNLMTPSVWYAIFDFNDEAKTGKNWSLVGESEVGM